MKKGEIMLSDQDINKMFTTLEEIKNSIEKYSNDTLYQEYGAFLNNSHLGIKYEDTLNFIYETVNILLDFKNDYQIIRTISRNGSIYTNIFKNVPNLVKQKINEIINSPAQAKQLKYFSYNGTSINKDAFGILNILYYELDLPIKHFALDLRIRRFPGYQKRLNQLKDLIQQIKNNETNLHRAKSIYEEILKISKEIEKSKQSLEEIQRIESTGKGLLESIQEQLDETGGKIKKVQEKTENFLKEIETYLSEAKNSNEEISRIKGQIKNFFDDIESYKEEIENMKKKIKTSIEEYENKTIEIIKENENLQKSIQELLKKAIAGSLFESFEKRKETLQEPLKKWLIALGVLIFGAMGIAGWIYLDLKNTNPNTLLLILKISMLAPIIYAIYFVAKRYTQERQLTEEYAFKSTVSLSMNAFNDLLKKYQDDGISEKQLELMVNTIDNLFKSPTDKVFKKDSTKEEKELIENFIDIIKNIKDNIVKKVD